MLIAEGRDPKQAAAIAYAKAGRKPKANAQELTREYLLAFYTHAMEHPDIFGHIKEAIHTKARGSAGGKLHGKKMMEGEYEEEAETMLKVNAAKFGGENVRIEGDTTIVPIVLMAEGVRNGALHRYEDFSKDYKWFEGVPIVPPHSASDPLASLVNHKTNKLGQVIGTRLNPEKRRVEADGYLFNPKFNSNDLARIQSGEAFGGSIGFFADDEMLPEKQTWTDGKEYNRIEKNFFGNHFSIVADPACPLGTCGFNVNSEVNEMTENKPAEAPKVNAEEKPKEIIETPKVNVENHIDLSAVLNKLDTLSTDFAAFKANAEADKAEIARLKAAEEVRVNAQKATEDKMISDFVGSHLLAAFQGEKDALVAEYKVNSSLFFTKHNEKIDWASFQKPQTITPAGAAFVPHVNEEDELKGLMPTDEEAGMRKVA